MSIKTIFSRFNSIASFELLRYKTKKYIHKNGYLIDKDILFYVFVPASDYYYLPYYQLYHYKNVIVHFSYINSNEYFLKTLRKSSSHSVFRHYINVEYDKNKRYVFFFDGKYSWCSSGFRDYLKGNYPGCSIIFHLGDLLSTHRNIRIDEIKKFSDLVVTYDHNDADDNQLTYHPDPYSKLPSKLLIAPQNVSHVIFYGYAKNRAHQILEVYDKLKAFNIMCDFSIPDLCADVCELRPELANAKFTPYLEYLKKVQSSNCILEIIQGGSRGCTFRTWEAVVYNKKLITNNISVKDEKFYNPKYIQVIDSVESIDVDWILNDIKVDYGYADQLSPEACLEFYLNCIDNA